jgi:hypothetical protein
LKARFEKALEKFNKVKDEYDNYNQQDTRKADEKLQLLKNKISQYGGVDMKIVDVVAKHEKLLNSEENRAFAEFKVKVSSLAQEIKIMKAKQNISLEDLRNQ